VIATFLRALMLLFERAVLVGREQEARMLLAVTLSCLLVVDGQTSRWQHWMKKRAPSSWSSNNELGGSSSTKDNSIQGMATPGDNWLGDEDGDDRTDSMNQLGESVDMHDITSSSRQHLRQKQKHQHHKKHHHRNPNHKNKGTLLCQDHDYSDLECSMIKGGGCCTYDEGQCFSAVGNDICYDFTEKPSTSPTSAPTTPTRAPTLSPTDATCGYLMHKAYDWCSDLTGGGSECVNGCWKKIEKKVDSDEYLPPRDDENYARLFADSKHPHECRIYVERHINKNICWPKDCAPVMKYFCGKFIHQVLPGKETASGDQVYVEACDVCVNHYIYASHPIHGWQCWFEHSNRGGGHEFCSARGQEYRGDLLEGGHTALNPKVRIVKQHGTEINKSEMDKIAQFKNVNSFLKPI